MSARDYNEIIPPMPRRDATNTDAVPTLISTPELDLKEICKLPNICVKLDDAWLDELGGKLYQGYTADLQSRTEWDERYAKAQKIAMQLVERKTFPWPGASNVKFPLVTIASLQFHARAYPALVHPDDLVRYKVYGPDEDGKKSAMGKLLGQHMTYQCIETDTGWEEFQDLLLMVLPILGCCFKKTYYDPILRINVSETVLPKDLVVNYWTKTLNTAPRVTHVMPMSENDLHTRKVMGLFRDIDLSQPPQQPAPYTPQDSVKDRQQGMTKPTTDPTAPHMMCEMHTLLDLDGDGYQEPYVVTFDRDQHKVFRIVARFTEPDIEYVDNKVARVMAEHTFTKYGFIPSPDGGFYDMGFGSLLGSTTHAVDTLINQLIDAGTLSNTAGFFFGKGVKIKGGQYLFKPFGGIPVDSTGDDLTKNIVPIPVRKPEEVLYKLLGFLVNYGERICSATDLNVGITPDQNTPAETSRAAGEAGMKVLAAIFQRIWRAQRAEFRILYRLNRTFLDQMAPNPFGVKQAYYLADPTGIRPSADPVMMSDSMRMQQAQGVLELAKMPPLGIKPWLAGRRALVALKVTDDIDLLQPPEGSPNAPQPPPNPKMLDSETKRMKVQGDQADKKAQQKQKLAKLLTDAGLAEGKLDLMKAQAEKFRADAAGVPVGHMLAAFDAQIGAAKTHHDMALEAIELVHELMKETEDGGTANQGGIQALEGGQGNAPPGGVPNASAGAVQGNVGI